MISSRNLILTISTLSLVILAANASDCVHNIDGFLYNLCPFKKPITIITHENQTEKYTLSISQPQVLSTHFGGDLWTTSLANSTTLEKVPYDYSMSKYLSLGYYDPEYLLIDSDNYPKVGLKIIYHLCNGGEDIKCWTITLRLRCDENMPHSSELDIDVDKLRMFSGTQFSAYSFFACPIKDHTGHVIRLN